jgi:hypothetical protein
MKKIKLNEYPQRDRQLLQEKVAREVERNPDAYLQKYAENPLSHSGRYVCSDLMKETFPEFAASNEARARYNSPLHNSAAVLADEQFSRLVNDQSQPGRDKALFVTGVPGAGKTSAIENTIQNEGMFPADARVLYEGQLSNPTTSLPKIQQSLDAGLQPYIYVVHMAPETALMNTLERFEETGRGASVHAMATIQSGLPDGLERIYEEFGDRVSLTIIDRTDGLDKSKELSGWENLPILEEGTYEQIKERLAAALEREHSEHNITDNAYQQALGFAPVSNGLELWQEPGKSVEHDGTTHAEANEVTVPSDDARSYEHDEPYISEVHRGEWITTDGGGEETRILIGKSEDGFHPGIEIGSLNQESYPVWGEAVPTYGEATEKAHEHSHDYHMQQFGESIPDPALAPGLDELPGSLSDAEGNAIGPEVGTEGADDSGISLSM